ncbi:MAG: hypothetical protein ACT4O9_05460 [Blastocatellia bacterium]
MSFKRALTILLVILNLLAVVNLPAQVVHPSRQPRTTNPNRQDPATVRWYEEIQRRENAPTGISYSESYADRFIFHRGEARKKLGPTSEEKREYASVLKLADTRLVRLAALTDCARILDITKPEKECLRYFLPGKAQSYSFRKQDYTHTAFSDIERSKDGFVLGGTFVLGLITSLGDTPIETVISSTENVTALAAFTPSTVMEDAARQESHVKRGMLLGNLTYRKQIPIAEGTTYLLRSVAFRVKFANAPKEKNLGALNEDDRQDVIVVFRVVKRGLDDSILILWKKIAEKDSPVLEVDLAVQSQVK